MGTTVSGLAGTDCEFLISEAGEIVSVKNAPTNVHTSVLRLNPKQLLL